MASFSSSGNLVERVVTAGIYQYVMTEVKKQGSCPQRRRQQIFGGHLLAKKSVFLLIAGFIFLQGCVRAPGNLTQEILSFDLSSKPERFKPLDVTSIVLRHIPLGKKRQAVISELAAQGFELREAEKKLKLCAECDPPVILADYTIRASFPTVPERGYIHLNLGFKQGKLSYVRGERYLNYY